ncbi:11029_t:CDS:2 [Entrophospora sp. SA101]|nr:11029_t:CDS:2 [Entrophospora sp. SA101]
MIHCRTKNDNATTNGDDKFGYNSTLVKTLVVEMSLFENKLSVCIRMQVAIYLADELYAFSEEYDWDLDQGLLPSLQR